MTSRAGAVLAIACVVLGLASCSSDDALPQPTQAMHATWSRVRLPHGFVPSLVAPGPDGSVLVTSDGDVDGRPGPRLLQVRDGEVATIPVTVATYYGRRTVWHGLTFERGRLYAFGGRSGGAHGNVRWTAWSGSTGGLTEDPQDFETFGGPQGGELSGVAVRGTGTPVLVGSRVSDAGAGLDVAVWQYAARRWVRRASAGTALAATGTRQPAVHGVARRGDGLLVVGSSTTFGADTRTRPAVWSAPGPDGPWAQTVLDADGVVGEAQAVGCDAAGGCLVVGHDDSRLALWEVSPAGDARRVALPEVGVGAEPAVLADPATGPPVIAAGDGHVLVGDGGTWHEVESPRGAATAVAATDRLIWLCADGRLWTTPTPPG